MNTSRLLLAAFAALLVGCQSADTTAPAPAPKAASKAKPAPAQYVFYVGTSGAKAQGVLRCVLDGKTGKISVPTVAAEAKSASYVALSPDAKFLYATAEAAEGAVAAYAVEGDKLRLLNTEASKGKGPTHLAVDAARKNLVVVNYGSGSTTALPIKADGSLAAASSSLQHVGTGPNAGRQSGPHAHGVYFHPRNGRAYVADLGTDDIFIYKFDAEKGLLAANKPKSGRVTAGEGPRHLAFHPNGKFAYVNTEMGLNVVAFSVERNGGLKRLLDRPGRQADAPPARAWHARHAAWLRPQRRRSLARVRRPEVRHAQRLQDRPRRQAHRHQAGRRSPGRRRGRLRPLIRRPSPHVSRFPSRRLLPDGLPRGGAGRLRP
jgi:hypothetical protein